MSYARGRDAEELAASFLAQRGLSVLLRNYRCQHGEIDLIAREGEILCFVEVRARRGTAFGSPIATVGAQKRRRLLATAAHFLAYEYRGPRCACRFDIVTIQGKDSPLTEWWPGAFEAESASL